MWMRRWARSLALLAPLAAATAAAQAPLRVSSPDGRNVVTVAIRDGRFRYVQFRDASGTIRSEELFDASRDARERENRLADESEVAGRMRARTDEYLKEKPSWKSGTRPLDIDEIQLNQLRALGYAVPSK